MEPPVQEARTGLVPPRDDLRPELRPEPEKYSIMGAMTKATIAMKTAPAIQSFWFFRKIANGLDIGQINPWVVDIRVNWPDKLALKQGL